MGETARDGRPRWQNENEQLNTLAFRGNSIKHNFGHGSDGLSRVLVLTFHCVPGCFCDLWSQARSRLGSLCRFFQDLQTATTVHPVRELDRVV